MCCSLQSKCSHSPKGDKEGLNDDDFSKDIILLLKLKRVADLYRRWTLPIGDTSGDEMSLECGKGVP
jgi:hypothetical protein